MIAGMDNQRRECFGYLRVSSDGQSGEDKDGLKRQQRAIAAYAKANGFTVAKLFSDDGVSGTVPHSVRPAFKQLLAALYSDGIKTVIVEDVDRLGRDAEIIFNAIGDLKRAGFILLTSKGQDLTATGVDARLKTGLDAIIAEYARGQLVERLKAARNHARSAQPGYREGRKPYGARDGEHEVITRIRLLRAEGLAYDTIAERLNAEAIPARKGRWHPTQVQRVLSRPA